MMFGIKSGLFRNKSKMRLEYALLVMRLETAALPAGDPTCESLQLSTTPVAGARRERVLVAQAPCF